MNKDLKTLRELCDAADKYWVGEYTSEQFATISFNRIKDISTLIDVIERLRGALNFYATGDYQEGGGIYDHQTHEVDWGERAEQALKGTDNE